MRWENAFENAERCSGALKVASSLPKFNEKKTKQKKILKKKFQFPTTENRHELQESRLTKQIGFSDPYKTIASNLDDFRSGSLQTFTFLRILFVRSAN